MYRGMGLAFVPHIRIKFVSHSYRISITGVLALIVFAKELAADEEAEANAEEEAEEAEEDRTDTQWRVGELW